MKRWFLALLVLAVIYIPIFPCKQLDEISILPEWIVGTKADVTSGDTADPYVPFLNESEFGYVTLDGRLMAVDDLLYNVAIDATGYVNYSSIGTDLAFQLPDGTVESLLPTRGYAHFFGGRLFVLATNATRLEQWSVEGELIWARDFGALITAIDANRERILVGLLDGRILVFDSDQNIEFEQKLSSGRIDVVYGGALGTENRRLAVVHGLDPQVLSVFEQQEDGFEKLQSITLENEFRSFRMVYFAPGDEIICIEDADGAIFFSVDDQSVSRISLEGTITGFGAHESERVLWITSQNEEMARLMLTTETGVPVFSDAFMTGSAAATSVDSKLILSVDARVGAYSIVSK